MFKKALLTVILCSTVILAVQLDKLREEIFESLTQDGQNAYFNILFNDTLTLAEIDQEMDIWAQKYGIAEKWAEFQAAWEARKLKFRSIIVETMSNLPMVNAKMLEIGADRNQTKNEVERKFEELKEKFNLEFETLVFMLTVLKEAEEPSIVEISIPENSQENGIEEKGNKMFDGKKSKKLMDLIL